MTTNKELKKAGEDVDKYIKIGKQIAYKEFEEKINMCDRGLISFDALNFRNRLLNWVRSEREDDK